ncbi:aldo/keto reductase [Desulfofustis glycolicus]|uniref:Predicted oxidoreductase n=1 Tax=Desulfofustis glycolicus DSM 9705 TaxID=1121409 RepID=A0A1M5YP85_9BACT|nr:aldo/keto reductase [Desulfofustis glycolicus]MCB2217813.1 aldo/keto reductase [Desulfobulbaceae bacterium]SHI13674.1 Predicted oxidoreductase [Desulfofustis glycolicus DSM 9705]
MDGMRKIRIGKGPVEASVLGLGCWGMSHAYGPADRGEALATIQAAVAAGVNLLDTADVYGAGDNEVLVGEAVRGIRDQVVIASKFGFRGDEHGRLEVCGRPDYVHQACDASLQRLATDRIDLYFLHRLDPQVPIEETVGAMAELVAAGKVRAIGLSEVSAERLRRAETVHHVAALQSEYSLFSRDIEHAVLPACRELGTTVTAFSPLGRGILTGALGKQNRFAEGDYRRNLPRFQDEQFHENLKIVEALQAFAAERGCTVGQLALAWLLHQGNDILPLPGTRKRQHLLENIGACSLSLSTEETELLRRLTTGVVGERHNEDNLRFIDSD